MPFVFEFYTSFGAAYSVVFVPGSAYFTTDHTAKDFIYSVDIKLLNPGPYNHYDFVIGITVAEIFFHFFSSDERRIIFYICDPVDGKMKARKRKFDCWFSLFQHRRF